MADQFKINPFTGRQDNTGRSGIGITDVAQFGGLIIPGELPGSLYSYIVNATGDGFVFTDVSTAATYFIDDDGAYCIDDDGNYTGGS